MMLIKYKLVNIEGINKLYTRHGDFDVLTITDKEAEKLFYDGSRYVVKADPEPDQTQAQPADQSSGSAVVRTRKGKK